MTTWHEDDTPEDVAFFLWHNTAFDDFSADRIGVFILGIDSKTEAALEAAISAYDESG